MTSFVVKNNAESLVADNPLAQAAVTLNVTSSEGANFPSTFPFLITIWDESVYPDPSDDSGMEIVKCTARTTDALTIVRAQESTADVAHALGERVAMLITAGILNDATYGLAASGGDAAYVIAANDTPAALKNRADASCDAVSDETEINTAFATYDTVILTEGTFIIDGSISYGSGQSLIGSGPGTIIKIKDSFNSTINMIVNSDQASGNTNLLLANLTLDGNRANQTTGNMFGVEWEKVTGSIIRDCWIKGLRRDSHRFQTCERCVIIDNVITDNGYGPSIESSSKYCSVLNNMIYKTLYNGVYIDQSFHISVKNNTIIASSQYTDNTYSQIYICGQDTDFCDFCDVQGNTIRDGEETNNPKYAIEVLSSFCHHTLIANNDCYDCAQTGTFSDAGTNTNWGAGNRKKDGTWATGA